MNTKKLKTVSFALVIFLMSGFVTQAQAPFYDTKFEDGKVVSRTKYVMMYSGFYERESESKYTYNEEGDFLKKEFFVWNKKYKWNDKAGRMYPDYSDNNWTPKYSIVQKKDFANNFINMEFSLWNNSKKAYNSPAETMIFQLNDANYINYLAFQKGNEYDEVTNNINFSRELLALMGK